MGAKNLGPGRQVVSQDNQRRQPISRSGRDPGHRPYARTRPNPQKQGRNHTSTSSLPITRYRSMSGASRPTGMELPVLGVRARPHDRPPRYWARFRSAKWLMTAHALTSRVSGFLGGERYVSGPRLGAVRGALPGAAKAALQVVATGDGVLVPLVYACLPTGCCASGMQRMGKGITA